jgi:ankyrin repeat protein
VTLTGPTPILDAVYRGDKPARARLLDTGTRPTLFEAAAVGDASLIKRLGAESPSALATRSPDGWPPLHLAAHFAHGDAVEALLTAKADVRARAENSHGNTALHAAVAGRAGARVIAALLCHGADVNAEDAGGYRPLHLAAFEGDAETVQTLLAHGAVDAPNHEGKTALQVAEECGHAAIARRLRGELP